MNDAISRQAALAMTFTRAIDQDGELYVPWDAVRAKLYSLPPAESLACCKECEYWDADWAAKTGTHYCTKLNLCTTSEFYCGYASMPEVEHE